MMYNQIKKQSALGGSGPIQKIKQLSPDDEFKPSMFKTIQNGLSPPHPVDVNEINLIDNANLRNGKKPQTSTMGEDPPVPAEDNDINLPHNMKSQGLMKRNNQLNPTLQNVSDIHEPFLSKLTANVNEDLLENEELNNMINPVLYVRGVPSEDFYLILTGKVMICSGNEGFLLEQQPFNYMGTECLTNDNYVPDFSAKVIGKAKLLKI